MPELPGQPFEFLHRRWPLGARGVASIHGFALRRFMVSLNRENGTAEDFFGVKKSFERNTVALTR